MLDLAHVFLVKSNLPFVKSSVDILCAPHDIVLFCVNNQVHIVSASNCIPFVMTKATAANSCCFKMLTLPSEYLPCDFWLSESQHICILKFKTVCYYSLIAACTSDLCICGETMPSLLQVSIYCLLILQDCMWKLVPVHLLPTKLKILVSTLADDDPCPSLDIVLCLFNKPAVLQDWCILSSLLNYGEQVVVVSVLSQDDICICVWMSDSNCVRLSVDLLSCLSSLFILLSYLLWFTFKQMGSDRIYTKPACCYCSGVTCKFWVVQLSVNMHGQKVFQWPQFTHLCPQNICLPPVAILCTSGGSCAAQLTKNEGILTQHEMHPMRPLLFSQEDQMSV